MAEAVDNGGAAINAAALALLPLPGGAAVAAAAAMAYEVAELAKLKNDVQALLDGFGESDIGPGKISQDWLEQGALAGPGFHEADFLFSTYEVVRHELLTFSKVLGLQMESMNIAIALAQTGYEDVDEGIKARMGALNAQITDLQREQIGQQSPRARGGSAPVGGDTSSQGF
ncbi:hypothetical protein ACIRTB_34305 [Streptomyces sp. NPDC101158]|uniref:hypothetical protein n=1 Tax=Streptomyces sp. NPDC101158 TaxID=3366117 RepID=UPI0037FBDA7F